jgi:uncharacterized protein (DUF2236 family)
MVPVERVRSMLAEVLIERIAGAEADRRRVRILDAAGPRWFEDGSPIRRVHGDAAMFVGGLRALLLQLLHPLAIAGVAAHSGYRGDPWGRLQRTSEFLAVTTFGAASDAEEAVARVRGVHERVRGVAPDGRPFAASDPRLLTWVHVAEVDSFLTAYQRYGAQPLTPVEADEYVAQTARVAHALGAEDVPISQAELAKMIAVYRPELHGTGQARDAARYLLLSPPLPLPARPAYAALATAAVGLLPRWARWPLRLPWLPIAEATVVRAVGHTATGTIRWVMSTPSRQAA